jgi:hypothetical protein
VSVQLEQQLNVATCVGGAVVDANADGRSDLLLATGGPNQKIQVALGQANGAFAAPIVYGIGSYPTCLLAEELVGQPGPELVVGLSLDREVDVRSFSTGGVPGAPMLYPVGGKPAAIAIGDLDHSGSSDIVVACNNTDDVSILLSDGLGGFLPFQTVAVGNDPRSVLLADVNSDSDLDMVVAKFTDGLNDVAVFLGNGDGTFSLPANFAAVSGPICVKAADLDGDGSLDLVVVNSASNTLSVMMGQGDGSFAPAASHPTGTSPQSVTIRDLDSDGVLDLLTPNYDSDDISVLLGLGGGQFSSPYSVTVGAGPIDVIPVDLLGDSADELVVIHLSQVSVYSIVSTVGDDDAFAPNHSCATSVFPGVGTQLDLRARQGLDDFYAVDVLAGMTLIIEVDHIASDGNLDIFAYDATTFGVSCGDEFSAIASATTGGDVESLSVDNLSGVTETYFVQVGLRDPGGLTSCNAYSLSVSVVPTPYSSPMCSGDGSLSACPCGNESSDVLSGCRNATGVGARISMSGTNLVASDDAVFHLLQARVGQPALLIQGWNSMRVQFRDGILCMGNPTDRLEVLMVDGSGAASTTGSVITNGDISGPGVTRYYQFWYRDPLLSPCGTGSNLSSGLRVNWQ